MQKVDPALTALVEQDSTHACEGVGTPQVCVRMAAAASLPSRFGDFAVVAFYNNRDAKEHIALVHGDVVGGDDVPTRLHSECLTGDVLASLCCDCRDQLEEALVKIAQFKRGILLYLRQEGRGIGLIQKIRAYQLQERGLDTVDANLALGFREDERDYAIAAHMLASLRVQSVQLMTNNPHKITQLQELGVKVTARLPHIIAPNDHNRFYLQTKAERSGHLLDADKPAAAVVAPSAAPTPPPQAAAASPQAPSVTPQAQAHPRGPAGAPAAPRRPHKKA